MKPRTGPTIRLASPDKPTPYRRPIPGAWFAAGFALSFVLIALGLLGMLL